MYTQLRADGEGEMGGAATDWELRLLTDPFLTYAALMKLPGSK